MAETQWDKAESVIKNIRNGNVKDAKRILKSQSRTQRYITISAMQTDLTIPRSTMWEWIRKAITGDFS